MDGRVRALRPDGCHRSCRAAGPHGLPQRGNGPAELEGRGRRDLRGAAGGQGGRHDRLRLALPARSRRARPLLRARRGRRGESLGDHPGGGARGGGSWHAPDDGDPRWRGVDLPLRDRGPGLRVGRHGLRRFGLGRRHRAAGLGARRPGHGALGRGHQAADGLLPPLVHRRGRLPGGGARAHHPGRRRDRRVRQRHGGGPAEHAGRHHRARNLCHGGPHRSGRARESRARHGAWQPGGHRGERGHCGSAPELPQHTHGQL